MTPLTHQYSLVQELETPGSCWAGNTVCDPRISVQKARTATEEDRGLEIPAGKQESLKKSWLGISCPSLAHLSSLLCLVSSSFPPLCPILLFSFFSFSFCHLGSLSASFCSSSVFVSLALPVSFPIPRLSCGHPLGFHH